MPNVRCKFYDDEGNPVSEGCYRQGWGCEFVHPSEPGWDQARRFVSRGRGGHVGGFGRGAPSVRDGLRTDVPPPTGPRRGTTNTFGPSSRGRGGSSAANSGSKTGNSWDISSAWIDISASEGQPAVPSVWSTGNDWGSTNDTDGDGGWRDSAGSGWKVETSSKNESKETGKEKEKGKEVVESAWGPSTGAWNTNTDSRGGGWDSWNTNTGGSGGDSNQTWSTGGGEGDNPSALRSNEVKKDDAPKEKKDVSAKSTAKGSVYPASNIADISGWGTTVTSASIAASMTSTNNDSSGSNSTASVRDDKRKSSISSMLPPPVPQSCPSVDTKLSDRAQLRLPTQNMLIPASDESTSMDIDWTVSTPLISPTTARDTYFTASIAQFPPRTNAIASSSRVGSAIPPESGSSSAPKSFKDVSRGQSRGEWDKFLRLLARAQRLCKEAEKADRDLKQYKDIQHSPHYSKVGKNAAEILDAECAHLTQVVAMSRQNYEKALSALIALEDAFDFPIQALVTKDAEVDKVRHELQIMKGYIHDVKMWMDPVHGVLEELDERSKRMPEPQAIPSTTIPTTSSDMSVENPQAQSVQKQEAEKRVSSTLKYLKAKKVGERLEELEDKASQLQQVVEDLTSGNQLWDLVQSKLEDLAYTEEESEHREGSLVMEQVEGCRKAVESCGSDVEVISDEVATLLQKVANLENGVNEIERLSSLNQTKVELASMKSDLEALRQQNDLTSGLVNQAETRLRELRALADTMQSASTHPEVELPTVESIVDAILPFVREQIGPDVTTTMEKMKEEVFKFIQEDYATALDNIWKEIHPVLITAQSTHERLERKGILRPRPVSPHTPADSRLGSSSHPNHT